ncbi:sugar phosphate nucleotidyltransferase [Candidatus Pelagibacter communis]|uniref:sugar phosphate nucleotidyltransferase n=1 Tax=Pelagibacter ubique TaxID=198252 RepID=UPI00094D9A68|nr:sugar phosphate nucleotidyltransferase [Candidatus Pelagibacter ubique]
MKINTALILCAGFGKRLNPITLNTPKPLLEIKDISMLERCIHLIEKLGIQKILINTFYLKDQFSAFLNSKNFNIDIKIIEDGEHILDTGGGIQNMIKGSNERDFIIFNPDTIWSNDYKDEILKMETMYFSEKLENILLLVNKRFSFDKKLKGDFNLKNNLINKEAEKEFIYIGCQIINKKLFIKEKIENYSILEIWNNLLDQKKLFGYESQKKFYHLTDLDIFKKLKDL